LGLQRVVSTINHFDDIQMAGVLDPAIVSPELFDYVQQELQRRKGLRFTSSSGCFAGRIFCGECGSVYGAWLSPKSPSFKNSLDI